MQNPGVCVQAGPFKWMTYAEAGKEVDQIGSALHHIGLKPVSS